MASHLILQLGGNSHTRSPVAQALQDETGWPILISTDNKTHIDRQYEGRTNWQHDFEAWDTVTNFTCTWRKLRRYDHIHVVTDPFHMERSMGIARAITKWTGVKVHAHPTSLIYDRDESTYTQQDIARAQLWRWTRVLVYWAAVHKQRKGKDPERFALFSIGI